MLITKFPYLYQHIYFVVSKRASLFKIYVIKFILIIVGMKVLEKNHHSTLHKNLLPKFKPFIMIFDTISWKQLCEVPIHCVCYL